MMLGLLLISNILRTTTPFSIARRGVLANIRNNDSFQTNNSIYRKTEYLSSIWNRINGDDSHLIPPPPVPVSPLSPPPQPPPSCNHKLDAILLIHLSGDKKLQHHEKEKVFMKHFAGSFGVHTNFSRVGLGMWRNNSKVIIKLNDHPNTVSFIDKVDRLKLTRTTANIEKTLNLTHELFDLKNGGRPNVRQLLVLLTDDPRIEDSEISKVILGELRQAGIWVVAIFTGLPINIAVGANILHVYSLEERRSNKIIENIVDAYCSDDLPSPLPLPREGGPNCDYKVDVVILLDAYGGTFNEQRDKISFVKSLVKGFGINLGFSRLGFVVSSNYTQYSIKLNEHLDTTSFIARVDTSPTSFSKMDIDKAIRFANNTLFDIKNGARHNVPKLLIIVTGNDVSINVSGDISNELQESGIIFIAVGIGTNTNVSVLSQITSAPENVFHASYFSDLVAGNIVKNITERYCKKGPCKNDGCQMIVYRSCPDFPPGCGIRNNESCEYLASGKISNPMCARNACSPIISNGQWQSICDGIEAFEIIGPCTARLARGFNGSQPFERRFITGFHGIRGIWENDSQYSGNVKSVKMICSEVRSLQSMMMMKKKGGKEGYSRNAGVVLSVGFVALIGSGFL